MTRRITPPRRLVAGTPTVMEEAIIMASMPPDLSLEVPTSIEDLGSTMKHIHDTMLAHHVPREVRAATATRRTINKPFETFAITLTLVQMPEATSKTLGPHVMKQRWNVAGNSTPNMRGLLPVNYHFLPAHQDFTPSPKGSEPSGGLLVSRSLVLTPMTERPTLLSG